MPLAGEHVNPRNSVGEEEGNYNKGLVVVSIFFTYMLIVYLTVHTVLAYKSRRINFS